MGGTTSEGLQHGALSEVVHNCELPLRARI
jgi:hypothetical protein